MTVTTRSIEKEADDQDVKPACPIAEQCPENSYRDVPSRLVAATFDPCRNDDCFADRDPSSDEIVVVARGRATNKMHSPRDP